MCLNLNLKTDKPLKARQIRGFPESYTGWVFGTKKFRRNNDNKLTGYFYDKTKYIMHSSILGEGININTELTTHNIKSMVDYNLYDPDGKNIKDSFRFLDTIHGNELGMYFIQEEEYDDLYNIYSTLLSYDTLYPTFFVYTYIKNIQFVGAYDNIVTKGLIMPSIHVFREYIKQLMLNMNISDDKLFKEIMDLYKNGYNFIKEYYV